MVGLLFIALPRTAAAMTIETTTTGTATGDQTITVPTGLSNVTIVYCSIINDGDGAHTGIDGTFTFATITMTSAFAQVNNGNYHVSCYYIPSYSGGTGSQTMHYGNHGGFGTIQWAVYIISGTAASQPDVAASNNNAASANPSTSFTTVTAGSIAFEALGDGNTPTAASSQTVDQSSDTNLAVAHKTISAAGATSLDWTATSGSWAQGVIAIAPLATPTPPGTPDKFNIQQGAVYIRQGAVSI